MKKPSRPKSIAKTTRSDPAPTSKDERLSDLEDMVELLPEEERGRYRQILIQSTFSGPLPPPALFDQYEDVLPGSAERIVALTEREQAHRHEWEKGALRGELSYGLWGSVLGAVAILAIVGGAVYCAMIGQPWVGAALAGMGSLGIVSAFVSGRRFSHNKHQEDS